MGQRGESVPKASEMWLSALPSVTMFTPGFAQANKGQSDGLPQIQEGPESEPKPLLPRVSQSTQVRP